MVSIRGIVETLKSTLAPGVAINASEVFEP